MLGVPPTTESEAKPAAAEGQWPPAGSAFPVAPEEDSVDSLADALAKKCRVAPAPPLTIFTLNHTQKWEQIQAMSQVPATLCLLLRSEADAGIQSCNGNLCAILRTTRLPVQADSSNHFVQIAEPLPLHYSAALSLRTQMDSLWLEIFWSQTPSNITLRTACL